MDLNQWLDEFKHVVAFPDDYINLAHGALIIATDEYPDLDIARYLERLNEIAETARLRVVNGLSPRAKIELLGEVLFNDLGFRGNRDDYNNPRNSYLNDVLDQRTGIPITLSLVYLEVAQRLGLPIVGVGLPGHFIVKWRDPVNEIFIDPFSEGRIVDERGMLQLIAENYPTVESLQRDWLEPIGARLILARILNNLRGIFLRAANYERALGIIERMLILHPLDASNLREAGVLAYRVGLYRRAAFLLEEHLLRYPDTDDTAQLSIYYHAASLQIGRIH